jgi:membrane protein DedA with SNARE-associated domain
MVQAQAMVNLCATIGASTCYLLSYALGRGMIKRYMPKMMDSFQAKVHKLTAAKRKYWFTINTALW